MTPTPRRNSECGGANAALKKSRKNKDSDSARVQKSDTPAPGKRG